jgi:hypothetical protein
MNDLDAEAAQLGDWRTVIADHEDAIQRFDESRKKVAQMLREQGSRLVQPIYDRLGDLSIVPERQWSGAAPSGDESWSVFSFAPENWWVELKFSAKPDRPVIYVYDHNGKYKLSSIEPLGLEWSATDDEIVNVFVPRLLAILEGFQAGSRGSGAL